MLSFPLLDKIQWGGINALKALKIVHEKSSFSSDCILIIDEMYLQKSAQYQSGENEGVDKEGNLYKGTVAFMVVGFKISIPFVVWARHLLITLTFSKNSDFVCEVVTDNHSANVNAFSVLMKITL